MKVPNIHRGNFLVCRTLSTGIISIARTAIVLVKDLNGDVEQLALYNFRPILASSGGWIPDGTILAIKEPCLRYGLSNINNDVFIHVDSPSDVLFIHETDENALVQVRAQKWYKIS